MFPIHLNIDLSHTEKCIKLKYDYQFVFSSQISNDQKQYFT